MGGFSPGSTGALEPWKAVIVVLAALVIIGYFMYRRFWKRAALPPSAVSLAATPLAATSSPAAQ